MTDRSNGYERIAAEFLASRGRAAPSGIGAATVQAWARTLPAGSHVLELGCGSGVPMTEVLIQEGLRISALDASPTLVAAFHNRFPEVPVACESVEESAFFHQAFDAVLAWGLWFLLPVAAQHTLVRRMASVVVPGGRLLFTAPAQRVAWLDVMTGLESRSLGAETYREQLLACGFSVLREYDDEGQNHYYDAVHERIAEPARRVS